MDRRRDGKLPHITRFSHLLELLKNKMMYPLEYMNKADYGNPNHCVPLFDCALKDSCIFYAFCKLEVGPSVLLSIINE